MPHEQYNDLNCGGSFCESAKVRMLSMSLFKSVCAATLLSLALPAVATAATSLATISFDYGQARDTAGNPTGKDQPSGWGGDPAGQRDPINADNVRMRDFSTASGYNQFIQVFNLSIPELVGATIESFVITIQYAQVDSAPVDIGVVGDPSDDTGELWYARVLGSDNNTLDDDFFKEVPGINDGLASDKGTLSFTLSAANDGSESGSDRPDDVSTVNSAFQTSVDESRLRLRFREESGADDIMWIDTATVEVFGTPNPVPVPASGLLLVGAVGGMVALRRRKASK